MGEEKDISSVQPIFIVTQPSPIQIAGCHIQPLLSFHVPMASSSWYLSLELASQHEEDERGDGLSWYSRVWTKKDDRGGMYVTMPEIVVHYTCRQMRTPFLAIRFYVSLDGRTIFAKGITSTFVTLSHTTQRTLKWEEGIENMFDAEKYVKTPLQNRNFY